MSTDTFLGGERHISHNFGASSLLVEATYDTLYNELTVTFRSGAVYRYRGVPREEVDALFGSPSAGRAFGTLIKNHYGFERLQ